MKKEIFKKGLAILLQAFPNKEINPEIAWLMLMDLSEIEYEKAIKDILSTKVEIYPNTNMIALIRERAKKNIDRLTAGEAWEIVLKTVSKIGHYGYPRFEDELTERAVSCIGWKDICLSENIGVERAHFFKVYETLERREEQKMLSLPDINTKLLIDSVSKKLSCYGIGQVFKGVAK